MEPGGNRMRSVCGLVVPTYETLSSRRRSIGMRRNQTLIGLLGVTAAIGLVGCSSSPTTQSQRDAERVRRAPTPELVTLYQTEDDVKNVIAVMKNDNLKMMRQDAGRAFFTDRPSRLTREPVPW